MSMEMTKSGVTYAAIIDAGIAMAQETGLESLTIGNVAERAGLSKSGVFSRVGSREELQIAVLNEYGRRMTERALLPALRAPPGLPGLQGIWRGGRAWGPAEKVGTRGPFVSVAVR